jgi:hypothetical protein
MSYMRMVSASALALALSAGTVQAAPANDVSSTDTCLILARAKHEQWVQPRVLIEQSKTFADGSTKATSILVTENTAYAKHRNSWKSAAVSTRARAVPPPDTILAAMRLGTCTKGATVQDKNRTVSIYSFDYLPDKDGFVAHGKMWISESSGLPVREEMQDPAPPANAMVATAMSATYTYNDDVVVPRGAELADSTRLFNTMMSVKGAQGGFQMGAAGGR